MATTKKSSNPPSNAQPETSSGQPIAGYQPVSSTGQTPTAEQAAAYAPTQLPAQLGTQQLPQTQHSVTIGGGDINSTLDPAAQHAMAVAKLAQYFGLKDQPLGMTMEQQVVHALEMKYNVLSGQPGSISAKVVKPPKKGMTEAQARTGVVEPGTQTQPYTQVDSTNPTPTPNKKALEQIAENAGITNPGADPLVALAGLETSDTSTNPLTQIQGQTVAENYANFISQGFTAKGALTKAGKSWETALAKSGYLDLNSSLGTPTANQIQSAYANLLNVAVNGQQTGQPNTTVPPGAGLNAALAAGASIAQQTTANAPPSETYATVQSEATEFGVYLSPIQINSIADRVASQVTAQGSTGDVTDTIKDMVISQYDPSNPNDPPGVANSMYTGIQQAAEQYQVPMSSAQISAIVKTGLMTASAAYPASAVTDVVSQTTQQLQQQAAGLYPALATQIKSGITTSSLTAPYLNIASSITGVPQTSMLNANAGPGGGTLGSVPSKWSAFLQGGQTGTPGGAQPNPSGSTQQTAGESGSQGGPQMMTLDQWKTTLMTDPQYGFQNTQGAKNMASQLASAILNEFGRVNTTGQSNPFGQYSQSSALAANSGGTNS